MENDILVKRFERVKDTRTVIEGTWDLIERYIAPYRGNFFKDGNSEDTNEWRKPWIYDSTAVMSAQHLASSLHNGLTSSISRWFTLMFRTRELISDPESLAWIEECTNRVWAEIQESNFAVEINEAYLDLVNYGTNVLVEEELGDEGKWEGLNFKSIPVKECFFEIDKDGQVLVFWRLLEWSIGQMVTKFGIDKIPVDLRDLYQGDGYDPDKKYKVLFCIYRNEKEWKRDAVQSKKLSVEKRPYHYKYILQATREQLGETGGYHEMPAFIGRWRKTNDSVWGNAPAMIALSDTMTLNRLIELILYATEKAIDPPTLTTQRGLIGDLDLNAGGLTVVRDIKELIQWESKANFIVQHKEVERLQMNIKECFFINQLMLPPMGGTPATATEISVRVAQLERLMGTTITRIAKDILDPVVMRTFFMMYRAGRLPEMPTYVKENSPTLDIQYMGAMFKTQEASAVQNTERWLGMVTQISQFRPDVLDVVDWNEVVRLNARQLGVSATLQVPESEVKKIQDEKKQQQQQAQQAMIAEQQGKAATAVTQAQGETAALNQQQTTGAPV